MKAIILFLVMSSTASGCSSIVLKRADTAGSAVEVVPVMTEAATGAVEAYKQELDSPTVYVYPAYVPESEQQMHIRPVPKQK